MKLYLYSWRLLMAVPLFFHLQAAAQCSVDAGPDPTVYVGYAPMSCATLTANATGAAPFSYAWSNGASSYSIVACDQVTTTYIVTVTDANGCIAVDTVTVGAVDVRCGNGNRKVLVCHIPPGNPANAHTICISPSGVPAHLAHGCHLGSCSPPSPPSCAVNLGNDTSICSGSSFMLDAGTGFTLYQWSDSSSAQTLAVTSSGTYWVRASDTVNGCVATDTIVVIVHPAPTLALTPDSLPDSLGCRNITAMVSSGTPPFTFSWNTGDTTAVIHTCDTVATTYFLLVSDSNGCAASDSVSINVPIPCVVNFGPDIVSCGPVLLDPGPGFTNYLWSDSSTAQTLNVTTSGTYWLRASDTATGCIATDTINITVHPVPSLTLLPDSVPDSLGCRNITATVISGTPPFIYNWNTGDSTAVIHTCDSVTTSYSLMVTDSNGCSASDSVTITVIIPVPCVVNLGPDTTLCGPVLLDAGAGFQNYLWSDNSTGQTLSVSQSGTYWVQVNDSGTGCVAADTVMLTLFQGPSVTAVADTVPDSLGCVHITATITGGIPPYSYSWSNNDTSLIIYVCDTLPTQYIFTVTDSNGCVARDTAMVNDTSPRPARILGRGRLHVFPNPVLDNAKISFAVPDDGNITLELYNMAGTLLRHVYAGSARENTWYTIDFSGYDLHEGVYLLRLTDHNGNSVNRKFVLFRY